MAHPKPTNEAHLHVGPHDPYRSQLGYVDANRG